VPDEHHPPRAAATAAPDDTLVLAAVARAALHRGVEPSRGAPLWAILEHLAIARRSRTARAVRARVLALAEAGQLAGVRRHGVILWTLTRQGEEKVRHAREARQLQRLPESPQHRAWRNARAAAGQEIGRFRRRLRGLLDDGAALLGAEPPPDSDTWLELGEELRGACRRLGSATHCLWEWSEPGDAAPDIDRYDAPVAAARPHGGDEPGRHVRRQAMRAGRRNIALWREERER
jgi:hypothetical protein